MCAFVFVCIHVHLRVCVRVCVRVCGYVVIVHIGEFGRKKDEDVCYSVLIVLSYVIGV